jgi:hypothetical protein
MKFKKWTLGLIAVGIIHPPVKSAFDHDQRQLKLDTDNLERRIDVLEPEISGHVGAESVKKVYE